jgi:hypothetical protein
VLSRQPSGDKSSYIQLLQRWRVPSGVRLVLFCVQTALPQFGRNAAVIVEKNPIRTKRSPGDGGQTRGFSGS